MENVIVVIKSERERVEGERERERGCLDPFPVSLLPRCACEWRAWAWACAARALEQNFFFSRNHTFNFINHFSGCQMCTQQNKDDNYGECEAEFRKSYAFADDQFKTALARKPPRNVTHHAAVASSVYCVKHPSAPECAEAVKAFEAYERDGARDAQAKYAVKG